MGWINKYNLLRKMASEILSNSPFPNISAEVVDILRRYTKGGRPNKNSVNQDYQRVSEWYNSLYSF